MQSLSKIDPHSKENIQLHIYEIIEEGDPIDHHREIVLEFPDGARWYSTVWRDPKSGEGPRGSHFWEEPGMIITADLTAQSVSLAVDEIIRLGALQAAFERLN